MNRILECFKKYQEIVSAAAVSGIFTRPAISLPRIERDIHQLHLHLLDLFIKFWKKFFKALQKERH
jgi:hypothetical protein